MNRILSWFLVSLLLALSGPVQALSMASARGLEKSLYGRSAPTQHKYSYCAGDPINFTDPSGLQQTGEDAPIEGVPDWGHNVRQAQKDSKRRAIHDLQSVADSVEDNKWDILFYVVTEGASRWVTASRYAYGPAKGLYEVSSKFKSAGAIAKLKKNTYMDFVFDPKTQRFVVDSVGTMKHLVITEKAQMEGAIVGGRMYITKAGKFITDEISGTYGKNWTDSYRRQFAEFMMKNRVPVTHAPWGSR